MTNRIQNAIDVLLDAINNGTLAKGHCAACAVGNLVAHAIGCEVPKPAMLEDFYADTWSIWNRLFYTDSTGVQQKRDEPIELIEEALNLISKTGFSEDELAQIEYAFETNTKHRFEEYPALTDSEIKQDQIKGLEAVVKVMFSFDEIKEDIQEVFTSKVLICS